MSNDQREELPPERPRRRRRDDDDDYDEPRGRNGKRGNKTVKTVLIIIGTFLFMQCSCVIFVAIAAITALGSNANSTFSMVAGNPKPAPGGGGSVFNYKPLKTDVDRFQFQNDLFRKSPSEVTNLLGTPAMKKNDPNNPRSEWWYYTGHNPQTGISTKLPNTDNGTLVKLKILNGVVNEVEWEPKQ